MKIQARLASLVHDADKEPTTGSSVAVAPAPGRGAWARDDVRRAGAFDAVLEVFVEQTEGHRLQGRGDGRDLGDDVDAVTIVDHPLQAARLALDAPKPMRVFAL